MEKISEMIKRMCPEGVERVRLCETCEIKTGRGITKKDTTEDGLYPIISGGMEPMGYYRNFNREAHTVTVSRVGANAGLVLFQKRKFYLNDKCFSVIPVKENSIDAKFLYYFLNHIEPKIKELQSEGGVPTINIQKLGNIVIPIPPLSIQHEIVRILDSFTQLQSNLESEQAARQKQYEYYRNILLTFDKDDKSVEWKTLGEIGEIVRGNGLQKTDFVDEGVGCVHYGQIYTRLGFSINKTLTFVPKALSEKLTMVEPGNLIIACTSENVEDVCKSVVWLGNENIVTGGHACVFKHNENPKYIGYCFLTHEFFDQKKRYAYGAKVIDIKTEKLALIRIPIPTLERQQEIVSILDTFESLITNLKREIEARKAQYEYYREQLLTFE